MIMLSKSYNFNCRYGDQHDNNVVNNNNNNNNNNYNNHHYSLYINMYIKHINI